MIKLKDLLNEGPISSENYATDSKDGASKKFINDFTKAWKKVSIEQSKNPKKKENMYDDNNIFAKIIRKEIVRLSWC